MSSILRVLSSVKNASLRISHAVLILTLSSLLMLDGGIVQAQEGSTGWSFPIDITQQPSVSWRGFPQIVCDPYQNTHIFWGDNSGDNKAIYYRNDTSGNWSLPVDIQLSNPFVYFLSGTVSPQAETLHLAWANAQGRADLMYSRSPIATASSPSSWSEPAALDETIFNPVIRVDPAGVLHIVYAASDNQELNFDVLHIQSEDDGLTWSDPQLIYYTTFSQPAYIRIEMDIDGAGRIHVGATLRSVEYGTFSEVGYIRSPDGGLTWSEYQRIDNTSQSFQGLEWIAPYAFGEDEVHLTWHDPRRLHMWSNNGGESWEGPINIIELGAAFGGANALTKDSAGNLYAVTAWSDGVFVSQWNSGEWGEPQQVDNRVNDPHGQVIKTCQGNRLQVAYYDRTGDASIWYMTREVDAPHLGRQPVPEPAVPAQAPTNVSPTQEAASGSDPITTTTTIPVSGADWADDSQIPAASLPLVWGIIPALVVIFGVVYYSMRRSRQG